MPKKMDNQPGRGLAIEGYRNGVLNTEDVSLPSARCARTLASPLSGVDVGAYPVGIGRDRIP